MTSSESGTCRRFRFFARTRLVLAGLANRLYDRSRSVDLVGVRRASCVSVPSNSGVVGRTSSCRPECPAAIETNTVAQATGSSGRAVREASERHAPISLERRVPENTSSASCPWPVRSKRGRRGPWNRTPMRPSVFRSWWRSRPVFATWPASKTDATSRPCDRDPAPLDLRQHAAPSREALLLWPDRLPLRPTASGSTRHRVIGRRRPTARRPWSGKHPGLLEDGCADQVDVHLVEAVESSTSLQFGTWTPVVAPSLA